MDLSERHLYQDENPSLEHQLSAQFINPSWDRFRFYSLSHFLKAARSWESSQKCVAQERL